MRAGGWRAGNREALTPATNRQGAWGKACAPEGLLACVAASLRRFGSRIGLAGGMDMEWSLLSSNIEMLEEADLLAFDEDLGHDILWDDDAARSSNPGEDRRSAPRARRRASGVDWQRAWARAPRGPHPLPPRPSPFPALMTCPTYPLPPPGSPARPRRSARPRHRPGGRAPDPPRPLPTSQTALLPLSSARRLRPRRHRRCARGKTPRSPSAKGGGGDRQQRRRRRSAGLVEYAPTPSKSTCPSRPASSSVASTRPSQRSAAASSPPHTSRRSAGQVSAWDAV